MRMYTEEDESKALTRFLRLEESWNKNLKRHGLEHEYTKCVERLADIALKDLERIQKQRGTWKDTMDTK